MLRTREKKLRLLLAPTFSPASAQDTCLKGYRVISLFREAPLWDHFIKEDTEAQVHFIKEDTEDTEASLYIRT